ncbi:hypothetical protein A2999_01725 [Candidatus Wolfebacteria bacterium RIFCSPLOWO2_01_FULL_38_11]|uniref:Fibronectin, type III domain protein n=2 Tax=Candidatus Wolfeibacteriota TaxID=1752735 RepID=A0A0G0GAH4_9BACT|nr:MAG: Fibronectin, type III domain protein [Candidatus Wolfebacteria bacterium GW2011_GWC1_37_10]OGM90666.1 MAG: hypothetical protein A2999_01725 [Candidatus Wolfebacteria bacterium RIFCSPLOWO2_01_FULL_38_11]
MKNYFKFFVLALIISGLVSTSSTFAQNTTSTATSTNISALQAMIIQLEQQIKALKEQLSQLEIQTKAVKEELRIARNLQIGSRGDDVRDLQKFLKDFPEIYPEGLITGYFGPFTRAAIKKFQIKYELKGSGDVDQNTIGKLKIIFEMGAGKSGKLPPGLLIAPGLKKKGLEFELSSSSLQNLPKGIAKKIGKEWKKDNDDDDDDDCDNDHDDDNDGDHDDNDGDHDNDDDDCGGNNNATSTPDLVAPVISGIIATSTTATSTIINWNTNELADGKIWVSTSTPINTSSTPSNSTSTLSLIHQFGLSNLIASSTYYYVVGSTDAANNTATSTESTFITPALPSTQ